MRSTIFGEGGSWDPNGFRYFEAGVPSMIWVANDNSNTDEGVKNIDSAILYAEEISNTVTVGDSSIDNSKFDRRVYALFTPDSSCKYTFNIPVDYAGIIVSNSHMQQVIAADPFDYGGVTAEGALNAGETYLVTAILRDVGTSLQTVPLHITKDTLPEFLRNLLSRDMI